MIWLNSSWKQAVWWVIEEKLMKKCFFPLKESFPTLKMLNQWTSRKSKKMRGCSLSGLLVLSFRGIPTLKCADQSNKGDFSKIKHYQKWALGPDVFFGLQWQARLQRLKHSKHLIPRSFVSCHFLVLDDIMENPEAPCSTFRDCGVLLCTKREWKTKLPNGTFKSWFILYNVCYDL